MSTYKIRLVTGPTEDTFYRRMDVPRESYVSLSDTNRIILKHGRKKWRTFSSAGEKEYIDEKKELISGLVFKSRKDAELFIQRHKVALGKLAKENPTYKGYEVFGVMKRFMPESDKLNYWNGEK